MEFTSDDLVSTFVSITGATAEKATQLLDAADCNLERAVELYYSGDRSASAAGGGPGPVSGLSAEDNDQVRAPDRITRQTLIAPRLPSIVPSASIFSTANRTINAPFGGIAAANADPHDKKLAKLFKPPYKLMFKGTLAQAKEHCVLDKKWLLVNIQDETDFSCLVLNRDIWSDDFLEAVVQCSFVLVQWSVDSPAGRQYVQLYEPGKAMQFPYIALIDPQTGALIRTFTGPLTAERLAEGFSDFLEKNPTSFTKPVFIRGVSAMSEVSAVSLVDSPPSADSKLLSNRSADESESSNKDPDRLTGSKRSANEMVPISSENDNLDIGLSISKFKELVADDSRREQGQESGKEKFKVSFKLPDNKRVGEEFDSNTTVFEVFSYLVAEKLPADASGFIDLFTGFPPKSVLSRLDKNDMTEISYDLVKALLQSMSARDIMAGQLVTVKLTS